MTKDEARHKLRKEGYNVVDDNSVVTVLIPADTSVKKTVTEIEAKLKAMGYDASFAVKQVVDGVVMESDDGSVDSDEILAETADDDIDETGESAEDEDQSSDNDAGSEADESNGSSEDTGDTVASEESEPEYFDDDDSDMLLTEDAVQFSLDDFGLDF